MKAYTYLDNIKEQLKRIYKEAYELTLHAQSIIKVKPRSDLSYICVECNKKMEYEESYNHFINLVSFNISFGTIEVTGMGDVSQIECCSEKCFKKFMEKKVIEIILLVKKSNKEFNEYRKNAIAKGEQVW